MGARPRKTQPRNHRRTVRLTHEEAESLDGLAAARNTTVSAILRTMSIHEAVRQWRRLKIVLDRSGKTSGDAARLPEAA